MNRKKRRTAWAQVETARGRAAPRDAGSEAVFPPIPKKVLPLLPSLGLLDQLNHGLT